MLDHVGLITFMTMLVVVLSNILQQTIYYLFQNEDTDLNIPEVVEDDYKIKDGEIEI